MKQRNCYLYKCMQNLIACVYMCTYMLWNQSHCHNDKYITSLIEFTNGN